MALPCFYLYSIFAVLNTTLLQNIPIYPRMQERLKQKSVYWIKKEACFYISGLDVLGNSDSSENLLAVLIT
jgi:hypothetical protein